MNPEVKQLFKIYKMVSKVTSSSYALKQYQSLIQKSLEDGIIPDYEELKEEIQNLLDDIYEDMNNLLENL